MVGAAGYDSPLWSSVTAFEFDVIPELLQSAHMKYGGLCVVGGCPNLTEAPLEVSACGTSQRTPVVRPTAGPLGISESKENPLPATANGRALGSDGLLRRPPRLFAVEELARVLNASRRDPILFAPYFLDENYRTSDGYFAREELRDFLQLTNPNTRPLEVSAELCVTAQRAVESCFHLPAQHSADIVVSIGGALDSAILVGEMYWYHLVPPRSALHVVRDWVLDIGVKSRSHRRGVFDSDFTHFGSAVALRCDGTCVCFAHFAKLNSSALRSRWPIVGMADYTRPTPNSTDLLSAEFNNTARIAPVEDRRPILTEEDPSQGTRDARAGNVENTSQVSPFSAISIPGLGHGPGSSETAPEQPSPLHTGGCNIDGGNPRVVNELDATADQTPELKFRGAPDDTPSHVFNALFMGRPLSPSNFFAKLCAKVDSFGHSAFNMPDGVNIQNFTDRERRYILGGPEDFGLYREETSGLLFPLAAFEERQAVRSVMEELRRSDGEWIKLSEFRERNEDNWVAIRSYLEKLTDDNDICYCEDEGAIRTFAGIPSVFPWEGKVEAVNRRLDNTPSLSDDTQIIRSTYICNAPGRVAPMAVAPPRLANLDVAGSTLANMIPNSARPESAIPNVVTPVLNFYSEHKGLGRPGMVVEYLKMYPETSPNSAKLSAECMRLYFSNDNAHDVPIIYIPHRGWFVYDVLWKEQGEEKLELTQILQTKFLSCISNCLSLATRQNIFKQTRRGATHTRRKFLQDLEIALSSAKHLHEIVHEARLYFIRREPMDSNPMLLQLANATLDLETNTIRQSNPGDYLTKMSTISVPEYAMGGSCTDEPEEARRNRDWAYSFYGPFSPRPSTGGRIVWIFRTSSARRTMPTLLSS